MNGPTFDVGIKHPRGRIAAIRAARTADPLRPVAAVVAEVDRVIGATLPFGPIAGLLADDSITEILINGPGEVWVERTGTLAGSGVTIGDYELDLLIERILTPLGLRVDRSAPIVDARLPDGSRVNVVVPPLSIAGPAVAIRRFGSVSVSLPEFGPASMVSALSELIAERASILIVGPTSSGKTTLINALSSVIDPDDRIVCLEDTAELQLAARNLVRLEARPANSEGVGQIPLRDLVRTAMRMRPDRLIVGEVRGAEAFDLLLALTSGHRGCLTSCHGADPAGALRRLETLAAMAGSGLDPGHIRTLIHDGLDAVVAVERTDDGRRQVASIMTTDDGHLRTRWQQAPVARLLTDVERLRAC